MSEHAHRHLAGTNETADRHKLQSNEHPESRWLPRLLSPEELAAYLGIPLATIYRWRSRREGPPGVRVGRHVRYRTEEVLQWLDDLRRQET
jgi:excisionase family DNA binding protein